MVDCSRELTKTEALPIFQVFGCKDIWYIIKQYLNHSYTQDDILFELGGLTYVYMRMKHGLTNFSMSMCNRVFTPLQKEITIRYVRYDDLLEIGKIDELVKAITNNVWVYGKYPLMSCAIKHKKVGFLNWARSNGYANYNRVAII